MSKNISTDLKGFVAKVKKLLPALVKHAPFIAIILVLLIYLFVVWRISQLAGAEPPADQGTVSVGSIPKVDKNAINQIQALEKSNTEVHSLFNSARNNPFSE